jgi:hypothetical protein
MFQLFKDLFDNSKPDYRAKWSRERKEIIAFLVCDEKLPYLPFRVPMNLKSVNQDIRKKMESFSDNSSYKKFYDYRNICKLLDDCLVSHSKVVEILLYWNKADLEEGKSNWRPYDNGKTKYDFGEHRTYKEYYARLPLALRLRVIQLEKLSDDELIERVIQLSD